MAIIMPALEFRSYSHSRNRSNVPKTTRLPPLAYTIQYFFYNTARCKNFWLWFCVLGFCTSDSSDVTNRNVCTVPITTTLPRA